jgi:hypothetical protein
LFFAIRTAQTSHLAESVTMFSLLGLFVAPFSILFAVMLQLPLSVVAVRTNILNLPAYLLLSVILGAIAFFLAFELWTVLNGSGPNLPRSWEARAGRLLGLLVGATGGGATGSLWHFLVVSPAKAVASTT